MSISVLILTLNEEVNLSACLQSVKWSGDIIVFDSFSSDRTMEIAEHAGTRIVQRRFDNYAAQRNAALALDFKYSWILMIDADERVTPELRQEIEAVTDKPNEDFALFRVRRKDFFMGRWLRYSSAYPTWFARLIRKGRVRVERDINEEYIADGQTGFLTAHLNHFPFNKGIDYWFERHNRYSSMEALKLFEETSAPLTSNHMVSTNPVLRRKALKQLAYRLPGRPWLVFIYLYLIRMGFLDGQPGLIYCLLRTCYELMIDVKLREIHRRLKGLTV